MIFFLYIHIDLKARQLRPLAVFCFW